MKDGIYILLGSVWYDTHTYTHTHTELGIPRRTGCERGQRGVLWWKAWPFLSTWIEAMVTTKGGGVVGAQRNKGSVEEEGEREGEVALMSYRRRMLWRRKEGRKKGRERGFATGRGKER